MPDPSPPATQADLAAAVHELRNELASKGQLAAAVHELRTELASKDQLAAAVHELRTETKADLAAAVHELRTELASKEDLRQMEIRLTLSLAGEIARHTKVFMEYCASLIRVVDDRATANAQRSDRLELRLDQHIADTDVHRKPTRARRR